MSASLNPDQRFNELMTEIETEIETPINDINKKVIQEKFHELSLMTQLKPMHQIRVIQLATKIYRLTSQIEKTRMQYARAILGFGGLESEAKSILNTHKQFTQRPFNKETPLAEREEIYRAAIPFIKDHMKDEVDLLLCAIQKIPEGARESVLEEAQILIRDGMQALDVAEILNGVYERSKDLQLSREKRISLLNDVSFLIRDKMKGDDVIGVLKAVEKLPDTPPGERSSICQASKIFMNCTHSDAMKNPSLKFIEMLIKLIQKIPSEEREEVCRVSAPLIKEGLKQKMSGYEISMILEFLTQVSSLERGNLSKSARSEFLNREAHQGYDLFRCLIQVYAEDLYPEIESLLNSIRDEDVSFLIEPLIKYVEKKTAGDSLPEFKSSVVSYFEQKIPKMMEEEKNKDQLLELFMFIEENNLLLGIDSDGPFMHLIISMHTQIDLEVNKDPSSIYQIHKKLLEWIEEPITENAKNVTLCAQEVRLEFASILRDCHLEEVEPVTFGQLPKINPDVFVPLFEEIERRLSPEERDTQAFLLNEESERKTYEELKDNCIKSSQRIYQWLHYSRGRDEETVPLPMVQMYKIVEEMLKQSQEVKEGEVLTDQESMLLRLSASVANCAVGQDDGIRNFYKTVTLKGKYVSKEEETVQSYLREIITSQTERIEDLFDSDTPLMRKLVSSSALDQLSHQTLYLRNLLSKDLGLNHQVTFDLFGNNVDRQLRDKSREKILKIVFQEYATQLISTLQEKIAKQCNESSPFYNALAGFCRQNKIPVEDLFELDENGQILIQEEGVFLVLKALGYLKQENK